MRGEFLLSAIKTIATLFQKMNHLSKFQNPTKYFGRFPEILSWETMRTCLNGYWMGNRRPTNTHILRSALRNSQTKKNGFNNARYRGNGFQNMRQKEVADVQAASVH